ncbi:M14 family zinc carboxypeptidase [Fictibacillus sp. B-59209]|uniref:M14 family zinc carboxypeptidase n=1 Tax=Fictibacillus sp. B-59209 TaxID=3024873 RepID=UPI002E1C72D8|nr:M14 family zinc carboxypeptidase [Fictibacillus sp. B-59209]
MKKNLVIFMLAMLIFLSGIAPEASAASMVNPIQTYTYTEMTRDIKALAKKYPDLIQYRSLGKSPYGREIWAVKLGKGDATVFYNASHHAREWLGTNIVMEMIDQYSSSYASKKKFDGYDVRTLLNDVSIWFVPMVNPDGVTLQQQGVSAFPKSVQSKLIKMNKGSRNFKHWKANGQGIDLNRQYPAGWNLLSKRISGPASQNYNGKKPLETIETKLMYDFTYYVDPEATISYHTSGRILYWHYRTKKENYSRDYTMAKAIGSMTGYRLVAPSNSASGGGYKDWFVSSFGRPGFTPELSYHVGETNVPVKMISEEWRRNKKVGLYVANEGRKLWEKKIKKVNMPITTFDSINLYDRPGAAYKTKAVFKPQKVTVIAVKGNYFRLNTASGKKWIPQDHYLKGSYNVIDLVKKPKALLLKEKTQLYSLPATSKKYAKTLPAGEVKAIKEAGNWYGVQTKYSLKWIPKTKTADFNPKTVSLEKTTEADTAVYFLPLDSSNSTVTIPQGTAITITKEWNSWQYVSSTAYKGWIKK